MRSGSTSPRARARHRQQHEGAHAAAPTLSSIPTSSGCASSSCASPAVHDAALVEDDRVARRCARTTPRFCSTSSTVVSSASRSSTRATSATSARREALRRLVDEQHAVVVQQCSRDRDHLLLPARERSRALRRPLLELGEELVDEVVPRLRVALGEPEVLRDGQPREDVAVLRHVTDAALDDPVRRRAPSAPRRRGARTRGGRRARGSHAASSSCRRRCGRAAP